MSELLLVDDDREVAAFMAQTLRLDGHRVHVAHDPDAAVDALTRGSLELVLLDAALPEGAGLALCRRLRADPSTAQLPVILLVARDRPTYRMLGATAGADDYLVTPVDPLELSARVRFTLHRHAEIRALSPLTGLPGNVRIDRELATRVRGGEPFALCYADLDHFKPFNDRYGFLRGDEVIGLLADSLRQAAGQVGPPPPFLGHIGGDDFVAVCRPEQAEPLCRTVLDLFDERVRSLHDPQDVACGRLSVVDRRGRTRRYPLVSVSIGVASNAHRSFRDHREVVAVATEMKSVAKSNQGSAIAVDRRSNPAGPPAQPAQPGGEPTPAGR